MPSLKIKSGTAAQINAAASANQLNASELYHITDESRIALGLSASTYQRFLKSSEGSWGGGAGSLPQRYILNNYYDGSVNGINPATLAGVANRLIIYPFAPQVTFNIDQIGVAVSTATAGSNARVAIYTSDANNLWPSTREFVSNDLSCAATGYVSQAVTFTFTGGVLYWLACSTSSTQTLRAIQASAFVPLAGLGTNGNATSYISLLTRTLASYATLPNPFTVAASDYGAGGLSAHSVRFRVSA